MLIVAWSIRVYGQMIVRASIVV
uniref:Uncharacterized protein n=1 Tax=Rhizophora mucronata TaxID=61149 RepID=A0A2P2NWN8_RHIMU